MIWPLLLAVSLVVSESAARGPLALRDWVPIGPEAAAIEEIVADPRDAGVVFAIGDDLLWRTRDGGRTWLRIADDPGFPYFHSLAMDESDPATLYVTAGDQLHRSDDGGESWSPPGGGLATNLFGTAVSAARPSRLYSLTGGGDLLRSDDRAEHWIVLPAGQAAVGGRIYWVRPDPLQADTVFFGVEGHRIFRSRDAGEHWAPIGLGLPPSIPAIVIDPSDSRMMYTTPFKSSDGGERWTPLPVFGQPTAINPASPSTVLVADQGDGGLHRSTDAGATWDLIGGGLPGRGVQAFAMSPADPPIVYAGTMIDGVLRSEDGGESWAPANGGFPAIAVQSIVVDPGTGLLYAATGSRGEARVFRRSVDGGGWTVTPMPHVGTLLPATFVSIDTARINVVYASGGTCTTHTPCDGGVSRSTDSGASWERLADLVLSAIVVSSENPMWLYSVKSTVALHPDNPAGELVRTSVRSFDGGETWLDMDVPAAEFAVDPTRPATLVAATSSEGVWRSTDGGASWVPSSDGLADLATYSVAAAGGTIYVGTGGGVVFSSDGGLHWSLTALSEVATSLVSDPSSPEAVYAGTDAGVFRIDREGPIVRIGSKVPSVVSLAAHGRRLWAATPAGVFEHEFEDRGPRVVPR